ncbi:MAG: endonuclease/exonuclease/phosphatase family protein [Alphaproteobacteria bacterium]|nr:endonuclease/exonuclease/phosphatase family protein [Alphaproteobacteria bacterium]
MIIANWNFERRGPQTRKAQIMMERLADARPDLVCLTEAYEGSTQAFGGCEVSVRGVVWSKAKGGERKVVLWSPAPWRDVDLAGPPGCAAGAYLSGVTRVAGQDVVVIGVCIPYAFASPLGLEPRAKPWTQHIAFLHGLQLAIAERPRGMPCIVMGDYNQFVPRTWGSKAAAAALQAALADLKVGTAGPMPSVDRPAIDHIAHSAHLTCESVVTLSNIGPQGERLSDHYGVVGRFRLNGALQGAGPSLRRPPFGPSFERRVLQ